jgi:hypothetical protein
LRALDSDAGAGFDRVKNEFSQDGHVLLNG